MVASDATIPERAGGGGASAAETGPVFLFVLASNAVGGAEIQTRTLLQGLARRHRIALLTHVALEPMFGGLGVDVLRFEDYGLSNPWDYTRRGFLGYARAIADAARRCHARVVYGVMHNASLFLSVARWRHPLAFKGRVPLGSLHGSLCGYFEQRGSEPTRTERLLVRLALASLRRVVTPSRGVASELVERFGARPERVCAIYNGFELENIRARACETGGPEKAAPWILTCCRLSDQKDFRTLIRAFARLRVEPLPELVVVGEGEMRGAILGWAREHGVEARVRLVGFQENPFIWIGRADVFVLSSFYEGFGNVIVEAMALGVPVVASDCPWGPAEIIEPGRSGEVFPIADDEALADVLGRLLSDTEGRAQLAAGARQRSAAFSTDRMVCAYSEVLDGAAAAKRGRVLP